MRPKNKKGIMVTIIIIALLIAAWLFIYRPPGGNRLVDRIEETALTSNVLILQESTWTSEGSDSSNSGTTGGTGYSVGASGTIIKHEGDRYYVLTAYHVIKPEKGSEKNEILIADYNDEGKMDPEDYQKYQGLENFFNRFPKARIEFYDKNNDLAVISFVSKEKYETIQIAAAPPKPGAVVGSLSNPSESVRNSISVGRIISNHSTKPTMEFYKVNYPLLTHTARTGNGSSGSMVLNENLELVGVVLGGTEIKFFAFQFFLAGKAMPSDKIIDFLMENGFKY